MMKNLHAAMFFASLMQIFSVASRSKVACMLDVEDQCGKIQRCVFTPTGCDYCLPQRDAYCRYCGGKKSVVVLVRNGLCLSGG